MLLKGAPGIYYDNVPNLKKTDWSEYDNLSQTQ